MPQKKPDFNKVLPESDALSPEEQAAAEAEERGEEPVEQAIEQAQEPEALEQPEQQPKGKSKQKPSDHVPYDRFAAANQERDNARAEAQRATQEAAELRERWARLEERQRMATEAQQRAQQAEADATRRASRPDPDVDPTGAALWDTQQQLAQLAQNYNGLLQTVDQRTQQFTGAIQQNQMAGYVQNAANRGRMQHADWDARVDFARDARTKFWMSVGHNEAAAKNIVANEEMALIGSCAQTGADPIAAVVQMTEQWGYKPNGNGQRTNSNGSAKLDQIAAGQRVQGLGRTQSAEQPAQKQWQMMDDLEFSNYIVSLSDGQFMEMLKDKAFSKKANELDLKGAA